MMTIDDMIGDLENARELIGGDAEVRLATQPAYPVAHTVAAVTARAADSGVIDAACWIAAGAPPADPYAPVWAWGGAE